VGHILAEQHTRIGPADLAGWLPRQVAWPEPGEWIRERVPQVVADADLIKGIDETLTLYEGLAVDEVDRVLAHTDVGLHNLALEPETLAVRGIFDYNDAAWADRHYDFCYLFDLDRPELLAAARAVYEAAVGVSLSHRRIVLYNAVSAFSYLAYRLGTSPDERPCGRTLAEDLDWSRRMLAVVRETMV
jgi:aminoglycoside phosphotransferase (APT) family kinase protein